jgi:uncharacterized protein
VAAIVRSRMPIARATEAGKVVPGYMATARTAAVRTRSRRTSAQRISLWRTPRTRGLLIVGALAFGAWVVSLFAHVYVDLLWFSEVGHPDVMWTTLEWEVLTSGFVGLGTTCAVLASLALAGRAIGAAAAPDRRVAALWRQRRLVGPLVAIACGLVTLQLVPGGAWKLVALWSHRTHFGTADPLFHRDVGFFVFSLPLYRAVASWLLLTLLMAVGAAVAAYAVAGSLRRSRKHLLVLGMLLFVVLAWRLELDRYALALPHRGSVVPGASYTDVHVRLPVLRARTFLALIGAGLCLYGAVRRVRLLPLAISGALVLTLGVATSGLPSLVERFDVAPQAYSRERPYVVDAIAATRQAFALDHVDIRQLPGNGTLTRRALARDRTTVENVPLWDASVLRPALNELESIGSYYSFPSASVDRYRIGGAPRVVTVAARQRDLTQVPPPSRTWANDHFAYTHGYGAVAVDAGGADADRYPRFAQRGFATQRNPLALTEPRTYFGQANDSDPPYNVVATGSGEVEAPRTGSQSSGYHYDGGGGIALSNLLLRAAFAVRFADLNLLLTHTINNRSRIIVHRDVEERVRLLAPFLRWDTHPQTVVADGRIQFVLHGYTTSNDYPYSAPVPLGGTSVNYLRSAAVAVVDGFDGDVSLYGADDADPILDAWRGAYPNLFLPMSQMPPQIRAHLRYPRPAFRAQAAAYSTYHADDPTAFWTGADAWQAARQLAGSPEAAGRIHFPGASAAEGREPYRPEYMLARLPGDAREQFILTTSFTPRGRQNLVAYLAGWVDDRGTSRLSLISLPRDRLTIGPSQATREILANPAVSRRLALLNRESRDLAKSSVSRTILGVQRVVPVGSALVYVQPVYVIAGGSGVPRLQLVTAYANGRVGYGRRAATALRRALPGRSDQRHD